MQIYLEERAASAPFGFVWGLLLCSEMHGLMVTSLWEMHTEQRWTMECPGPLKSSEPANFLIAIVYWSGGRCSSAWGNHECCGYCAIPATRQSECYRLRDRWMRGCWWNSLCRINMIKHMSWMCRTLRVLRGFQFIMLSNSQSFECESWQGGKDKWFTIFLFKPRAVELTRL